MFNKKPIPTFDDVASDAVKEVRRRIYAVARNKLASAATAAMKGDLVTADRFRDEAAIFRDWAVSIPLDMLEMERIGLKPFELEGDQ